MQPNIALTADGGDGVSSSITGSAVTRAGGGGSGAVTAANVGGEGGTGGGGDGGDNGLDNAESGLANTGGGGGGSSDEDFFTPGSGGSGIVIIRYAGAQRGSGGTVTSVGGFTIHTFTSSGTYTA
jgi:hypothetical protein